MKHLLRVFGCAICAFSLFACAKEIETPVDPAEEPSTSGMVKITLTALSEQTKTTIDAGVTKWAAEDKIKVICDDGPVSEPFEIVDGIGETSGSFSGFIPAGKTALHTVYPAASFSAVSSTTVKVVIPAAQNGVFGAGNVAVANVAADHSMAFKNVNAFISFTVPVDVAKVVISSVDGSPLAGTLSVDCSGTNPAATTTYESTASAITAAIDGLGGTYYVSALPGQAHAKGLLFDYYDALDNKTGSYYLNKNITTVANQNFQMGDVETNGNYYVTVSGAGNQNGMSWDNAMSAVKMWKKLTLAGTDAQTDDAKVAAIDGATFHLGHGTYNLADNPTITFSEASPVNLTFIGGYPAAGGTRDIASYRADITGNDEHACLNLRGKLNVTFDGIGFVHGSVTGDNVGSLDINGTASGSDITVSMSNCLVDNNVNASYSSHADEWAAGLVLNGSHVSFTAENVTFSNNKSHSASAVFVKDAESVFTNCSFHDNAAWYQAGAVYANANVTFNSCVFEDNVSEKNPDTSDDDDIAGAGAVFASGGEMIIDGGSFEGNTAAGYGGALMVGWGTVRIKGGAVFSENEAYLGGAIYNKSDNASTLRISDHCVFNENHATGWAGAIHFKSPGVLRVNDSTFSGNYSDGDSGAFNIDRADGKFTGVTFSGNHADGDAGGAMWIDSGEYVFTECAFNNNYSATKSGGAIYAVKSGGSFTLTSCSFTGNHTDNEAGGAMSIKDGTYSFTGCTFTNNYSNKGNGGGAIYANGAGTTKILSCGFSGNNAKRGGAISAYEISTGTLFIDACWFDGNYITSGNSTNHNGTTIYSLKTKKLGINNCSFNDNTYNTSDKKCDWIYIDGGSKMTELVISNCTLIGACRKSSSANCTDGSELLYVLKGDSSFDFYCINNVIISTGKAADDGMWVNGVTVKEYNNIYSSRGGSNSPTWDGSGNITDGSGNSTLSALSWDPDDHVYPWDGTGFSYTKISATTFATQIETGCSAFKSWLETEGRLNMDQLGNNRGDGSWVPGAYQPDV